MRSARVIAERRLVHVSSLTYHPPGAVGELEVQFDAGTQRRAPSGGEPERADLTAEPAVGELELDRVVAVADEGRDVGACA